MMIHVALIILMAGVAGFSFGRWIGMHEERKFRNRQFAKLLIDKADALEAELVNHAEYGRARGVAQLRRIVQTEDERDRSK